MTDRSQLKPSQVLDRVLVLEMVRVTEYAAIAASRLVGRGDEKAADAAGISLNSQICVALEAWMESRKAK